MDAAPGRTASPEGRGEIRDGMRIDWDIPVEMDDGLVLRADLFLPVPEGRYPVILSYGPYAKGLAFQDGYAGAWERMAQNHPDVTAGSSVTIALASDSSATANTTAPPALSVSGPANFMEPLTYRLSIYLPCSFKGCSETGFPTSHEGPGR